MPRPAAPRNADPAEPRRSGLAGTPGTPAQPGAQRKGWPFAQGSQNHLDETSAPWPRPPRATPAKAPDHKPGQ